MTASPVSSTRAFAPFLPVALALFCIQLDFFALGLALPVIAADFDVTTTDLQWVLSGYMLALGSLMIPASRIADLVGRKRVLLTGIATFGTASLICGLSVDASMLIGFRIIQGIGGALIIPVAFSLVTNATEPSVRPRVLGLMIGVANIGTAIGPILGGGLAGSVGWRWVFFVNVPICAIAFVWGLRTLGDTKDPEGHTLRQLDWVGAALVVLGVATLSLGIDGVSAGGLLAVSTLGALTIGIVAMIVFVVQERRHPWPMVSPALMKRRPFWALLGAGTFANMCMAVFIIIAIIQLQQVRGLSPTAAGLLFIFPAVASAVCGPISGRITGKVPAALVMAVSIVLGGAGMLVQAFAPGIAVDIVGLTICGLAFGMGYALTNVVTQSVLPEALSGQASGVVLTTLVTLGGVAVVIAAAGLELFEATNGMPSATDSMQLWTGVVAVVVGLALAWSQRKASTTATP